MVFGKGKGKKSYSSKALSRFGKLGGRLTKWTNEAERKRAERLKKKQLLFGDQAQLQNYRSYETILGRRATSANYKCSHCRSKSIWSLGKEGEICSSCQTGKLLEDITIIKRSGTNAERKHRQRQKAQGK